MILFQILQKVCVNKTDERDDTVNAITIIMGHVMYKQHKRWTCNCVELVRNVFLPKIYYIIITLMVLFFLSTACCTHHRIIIIYILYYMRVMGLLGLLTVYTVVTAGWLKINSIFFSNPI